MQDRAFPEIVILVLPKFELVETLDAVLSKEAKLSNLQRGKACLMFLLPLYTSLTHLLFDVCYCKLPFLYRDGGASYGQSSTTVY